MREFLEKNYEETSGEATIKLAVRALLETVESGGKNIEIAVMTRWAEDLFPSKWVAGWP